VLSRESTRERLRAQPGTDGKIGLGFFVSERDPGVFEHGGADEGFQADFHMNADTGKGFVIMSNSDNGLLMAWEIERSIAQEYRWKDVPPARPVARELVLIAQMKGVSAALAAYKHLRASPHPREPADEGILEMLGFVMAQADEKDEAIKAFAENAAEYPNSSHAFANLGSAYADANDKAQAIASFEKSLKLDPNDGTAKEGLKKLGVKQ
jgi:tetratricopeptide (TPR) repeat protein